MKKFRKMGLIALCTLIVAGIGYTAFAKDGNKKPPTTVIYEWNGATWVLALSLPSCPGDASRCAYTFLFDGSAPTAYDTKAEAEPFAEAAIASGPTNYTEGNEIFVDDDNNPNTPLVNTHIRAYRKS